MNLVIVASPDFLTRADRLIAQYRCFYSGKVIACHFGGIKPDGWINVPLLCEHAHNPRFYFYKAFAFSTGMDADEPFLYVDSDHQIHSRPLEIERALHEESRFLVRDGDSDSRGRELETCTPRQCFQEMGCDEPRYWKAPCYWAAVHAWAPTAANKAFAREFLSHMMNVKVAGPSNWINNPEPDNPVCEFHRNDQSCFSILVEKYGFHQPYDPDRQWKYGGHSQATVIQGIYA